MYNYTYYELDGSTIISETTYGSTIRYYYGNGGIVGFRYNGNRYYYEKNLMGDIIGIYDESGSKVAGYIYDAWGNCTVQTYGNDARIGEVNPFRYRGYYFDSDIGLYYLKSRYYDAVTGRFINADGINYLGANNSLGAYNLFAYCDNEPVINIDSNGNVKSLWNHTVENSKNKDGTYSWYDNNRFWDHGEFHEQFIVITPSTPSFGPNEGALSCNLGNIGFDLFTGGWEYEHLDISLFDFGHAEAAFEMSKNGINIGASASAWSPSVAFSMFGYEIEIGLEIGNIGWGVKWGNEGLKYKSPSAIGLSLSVSES